MSRRVTGTTRAHNLVEIQFDHLGRGILDTLHQRERVVRLKPKTRNVRFTHIPTASLVIAREMNT